MSLFAIAVAVGLAAGYARGGRLGRLGQLRLRAPVLAGLALAVQAGAGLVPVSSRFLLVTGGYALVAVWLVVNATQRAPAVRFGIGLLALGWLLNGLAMAPDQGMPVSPAAMERAGISPASDVTDGHLYKHVAGDRTSTSWLGDVIPVRPLRAVISLGDVALLAGIAACVGGAMASPVQWAQAAPSAQRMRSAGSTPAKIQEPGNDAGGAPRHRRFGRAWREPAPPGDDGGAKVFSPDVPVAAGGIALGTGGNR